MRRGRTGVQRRRQLMRGRRSLEYCRVIYKLLDGRELWREGARVIGVRGEEISVSCECRTVGEEGQEAGVLSEMSLGPFAWFSDKEEIGEYINFLVQIIDVPAVIAVYILLFAVEETWLLCAPDIVQIVGSARGRGQGGCGDDSLLLVSTHPTGILWLGSLIFDSHSSHQIMSSIQRTCPPTHYFTPVLDRNGSSEVQRFLLIDQGRHLLRIVDCDEQMHVWNEKGLDALDQAHSESSTRDVSPRLGYPPKRAPSVEMTLRDVRVDNRGLEKDSSDLSPSTRMTFKSFEECPFDLDEVLDVENLKEIFCQHSRESERYWNGGDLGVRVVLSERHFGFPPLSTSRAENLAADHLSRLENPDLGTFTEEEITDEFLDEHLMILKAEINNDEPWYADYVNYIVGKIVPPNWTPEKRRRFFSQVKNYFWDEPYEFKLCSDNVMRRCVAGNEILEILAHCHSGPTGGHHSASITRRKVYESGFYWPSIFKDAKDYVMRCDACQRSGNISSRSEMPQNIFRLREDQDFKAGYKVLLFNSRFKMHLGKLKSKWYSSNVVKTVHPYGTVEIIDKNGINFKVNGQRLKKYHDGHFNAEEKEVVELDDDTTHVFRPGPVWGCDRLVIRAKVIENQIMAASAIAISSDSSDESVGSPPSRVILFGDIPTVIPSTSVVAPETSTIAPVISSAAPVVETTLVASPTGLCGLVPYSGSDSDSPDKMSLPEHISSLPAISQFLCTDSSEVPDSSDGPPSQDPYVATVARWRSRITARPSSSSEFPITPVTAPLGIHQGSAILIRPEEAIPFGRPYRTHLNGPHKLLTARKRVGPLPACRLASRYASPRSLDHHSSFSNSSLDSSPIHSSGLDASDQAPPGSSTRDVPPRLCYPPRRAP
ncbi:reverse transcriptase domain-containing protein [Tanacetum coccineum]